MRETDLLGLQSRWRALDATIRDGWNADMKTAEEEDIVAPGDDWTWAETISKISGLSVVPQENSRTLLFLPFPFRPGAGKGAFPEMFAWDSYFINLALLAHGRTDLVRGILLNQLFMILRFGKVLNANRSYFRTRSQPPLHADAIWRYYEATGDRDMLFLSYPLLVQEYRGYWSNADHLTPTGLATNNDAADPFLRPELASEAETGFDFCALFGGDVRRCVPIATNAQLVRYCEVLCRIAGRLGLGDEAEAWRADAQTRAERIRRYCWDETAGFFFEYDFVRRRQVPVWSLAAYWTIWANVANSQQARRMVESLPRFEHERGLVFTDKPYPSPHREFPVLQWSYPNCWPPMATMIVEALMRNGYERDAQRAGATYLDWVVRRYEETGTVWEKYVAVAGLEEAPVERYGTASFYGWSAASVVQVGRLIGLHRR